MNSRQRLEAELAFSGEQVVPGQTPQDLWREHIQRYEFAKIYASGRRVLDVACGTGYGSAHLAVSGARFVVGGDLSKESLIYAASSFLVNNLRFVRVEADRLPFRDASFDLVVSFETVEHLEERDEYLEECRRILKEDGFFLSSTPARLSYRPPWAPKPENPYHRVEFTIADYHRLLAVHFPRVELYGQLPASFSRVFVQYAMHSIGRIMSRVPPARARLQPFRRLALTEGSSDAGPRGRPRSPTPIRPLRRWFPGFPTYVLAVARQSNHAVDPARPPA